MKDSRIGEFLWEEWDGLGDIADRDQFNYVFFTVGHVSLDEDVVRRALASAIQRDGIVDSLGEGYKSLEWVEYICIWAGFVDSNREMTICDEYGITENGDTVDEIHPITLIKFN